MTKAEVFKELLKNYEKEETRLMYECSINIPQSKKMLKKEISEWAKKYEEAKWG